MTNSVRLTTHSAMFDELSAMWMSVKDVSRFMISDPGKKHIILKEGIEQ